MASYRGTFRFDSPGFGFIKRVRAANGRFAPDAFLYVGVAQTAFGRSKNLLKELDGTRVAFDVRKSARHPDKWEAYNIRKLDSQYPF